MGRHAKTMIAAALCLLLFSGRLAAAEKSFGGGGGGGGGYGGLEAGGGGGQQPQPVAGGAGGYSTPIQAAPSTPAAAAASGGGGGYGAPAGKAGGGLDPDGDPEVGLNEKAIKEIIDEHNMFRAKENAGLPPLVWNATLAQFSQQYAETLKGNCQQIHSTSPYGENLMEGSPGLTWKITVDGWSEEKKSYHYASDTCDPGQMCGHYRAVVWKTTTSVGCGRIKCNSGDTIIMCSYWPPGNYDGQRPY